MSRGSLGSAVAVRVTGSRCVACNHQVVDAYLCDACAVSSDYTRRDDAPSMTATVESRAIQKRSARAVAHEHWMAMLGVEERDDDDDEPRKHGQPIFVTRKPDGTWMLGSANAAGTAVKWRQATAREALEHVNANRSSVDAGRCREAIQRNRFIGFTREELERWGLILDRVAPHSWSQRVRAIADRNHARAERRRWLRWCELWPKLALTAFADAVSGQRPAIRRPRIRRQRRPQ